MTTDLGGGPYTGETQNLPPRNVEELAIALADLDPKPVTNFTPDNLEEVMSDFLDGKIHNPTTATYSKLDVIDFQAKEAQYTALLDEVLSHPDIPGKHGHVYRDFVARAININELMAQAVEYRRAADPEAADRAKARFTELNHELYGKPEMGVATSMALEVIADTESIEDADIRRMRDEFINLLPQQMLEVSDGLPVRLEPSEEARQLAGRCVKYVYGPLLRRADEVIAAISKERNMPEEDLKITPQEIALIFQTIIDNEFPSSGWHAEIKSANAINVVCTDKTVVVPEKRQPATVDKVRGLVVHELGVHMMRSIVGEGADLIPLRFGLAGVGEAEEGLAKVMESVLTDDAARTGYQHYLTATLLNNGYDFRDAFEVMWRYKVLDAYLDESQDVTESFIEKQKKGTFKFMFRAIRGTNELPLHMTLNYFNGTHKIWEYIDTHQDDPDLIVLLLMGKIDPTNPDHLWGTLDAKSRATI